MKFNKSAIFALLAVAMLMTLSSCNRGVGCPSDFSILDPFKQLLGLF